MNKIKSTGSRRVLDPNRQSKSASEDDVSTSCSSGTLNIRQMAEDAAKVQEYIANGGKQEESSAIKVIKSSGLFNNRIGRR